MSHGKPVVSIATASYVLNDKPGKVSDETRARVRAVAERLGYSLHPGARQLRGISHTLLVLLPGHHLAPDLRGILMDYPFFNELLGWHRACCLRCQIAAVVATH